MYISITITPSLLLYQKNFALFACLYESSISNQFGTSESAKQPVIIEVVAGSWWSKTKLDLAASVATGDEAELQENIHCYLLKYTQ